MRFRNFLLTLGFGLLFLGFLDAAYLTAAHYSGANLSCLIAEGCDIVTTSKYSAIWGVPISLIGAGYYFTTFLLLALHVMLGVKYFLNLVLALVGSAFLVSLGLVYLQLFVIEAFCTYCLASAGATILLLIINLLLKRRTV